MQEHMNSFVDMVAKLVRALRLAKSQKGSFVALFLVVFIASAWVLALGDLLPNTPLGASVGSDLSADLTRSSANAIAATSPLTLDTPEAPVKIVVPTIGLEATIANPETINVATLNSLLLKGAVRYPTSAKLGQDGNVVLFGHSSYLPVVGNQAYKTFNDIQELKQGTVITVYSSGRVYTYAVRSVVKESANDGVIPLSVTGRVLTLATCNSFGEKSDRFVVTADFVESHLLGA